MGFFLVFLRSSRAYAKVHKKTGNQIILNIVKPFIFLFYTVLSAPVLLKRRVTVPSISIFITSRCTLRCRDCSNMIPYYDTPSDVRLEEIKQHMLNFLEGIDMLYNISIIGGEPFLYDELGSLLDFLLMQEKIKYIKIITNGTLLPREEWLSALKSDRVNVVISNYKYSYKLEECFGILNDHGIDTTVLKEDNQWLELGGVYYRSYTHNQLKRRFYSCPMRVCKILIHGRLYVCGRSATSDNLGFIPCSNKHGSMEYIDLTKSDSKRIRNDIRKLFQVQSLTACNYCNGVTATTKYITPAIQCNGTIRPEL